MTAPEQCQAERTLARIESVADQLSLHLNGPLLVMYYPDETVIDRSDVTGLYRHLRARGLTPDRPLPALNVVLHTYGGDPNSSYRLAQLLRDFAGEVEFIVPEYAYSGGTMIILAGDRITLAHCAVLSPIDVGFVAIDHVADPDADDRQEPVAIDHYIGMVANAKVQIESALREKGLSDVGSAADEALMTAMVTNPENAMRIGARYRQRNITEKYARQLLENYMLKDACPELAPKVIDRLICETPDHGFEMDYHICSDIGLAVSEADQELSDLSRELARELRRATEENVICERIKFDDLRQRKPFFLYVHRDDDLTCPEGEREDGNDQLQ